MHLDTIEQHLEEFSQALNREHYLVGAGLKDKLETTPIYERYATLFARETVTNLVRHPNGPRWQYLAEAMTLEYLENSVKAISEDITNALLQAEIEWDNRSVPFMVTSSLIVNEPDLERRHALEQKQMAVVSQQNPQRVNRWKQLHAEARALGFTDYTTLCDQLRALNLSWLSQQMRHLLDRTADTYFAKLEQHLRRNGVPRDRAHACDIGRIFRAEQFDPLFPAETLVDSLRRTLLGLGIDLDNQAGLQLDTEPRPLKSPRAFCAPIVIPTEVMLVIKPKGGQDDYRSLFHEAGHAEHFSHTSPDLPFAFRGLGDTSVTESFAFLFEHLTHNPLWLARVLNVKDTGPYRELSLFSKLWFLRRYASKLLYEQQLHNQIDGADRVYVNILEHNLGVRIAPERYLEDVDDAFYVSQYLRAWIFEMQLRTYLEHQYGVEWFVSPRAGKFLVDLWLQGQRYSVDELARQLGYAGLDASPLVHELTTF